MAATAALANPTRRAEPPLAVAGTGALLIAAEVSTSGATDVEDGAEVLVVTTLDVSTLSEVESVAAAEEVVGTAAEDVVGTAEETALLEVDTATEEIALLEVGAADEVEVAAEAPTSLAIELAALLAASTSPLGQVLPKQSERSENCLEKMH